MAIAPAGNLRVAEMPVMQERRYAQRNSVAPMSRLAPIKGGRLHVRGQLLPRFLKAPLIARRIHDICRAAAAREHGVRSIRRPPSAVAARVKNNFGEFSSGVSFPGIESGYSPK